MRTHEVDDGEINEQADAGGQPRARKERSGCGCEVSSKSQTLAHASEVERQGHWAIREMSDDKTSDEKMRLL